METWTLRKNFLIFFFFKIKANWADANETWDNSFKVQKRDVVIHQTRQLRDKKEKEGFRRRYPFCVQILSDPTAHLSSGIPRATQTQHFHPIPKLVHLFLLPFLTNGNFIHLHSQTKNLDMMLNHAFSLSSHPIAKFCLSFKNRNITFLLRILPWEPKSRLGALLYQSGSHQKNRNYSRYYRRGDLTQGINYTEKELRSWGNWGHGEGVG